MIDATTPIRDLMTPHVMTISADLPLNDAIERMHREQVRHLPVNTADGRLLGLVSARDLLMLQSMPGVDPASTPVEVAMTFDPHSVGLEATVLEALDMMLRQHIGAVLVTEDDDLHGIFTTVDAMRVLRRTLAEGTGEHPSTTPGSPAAA